MRKAALMILLVVLSNRAMAEWIAVDRDESEAAYADSATIRKAGTKVKMWVLYDFTTDQATSYVVPYKSIRWHQEFDCKDERARSLYHALHSGNMGGGDVIRTISSPSAWEPIAPGTRGGMLWKIACGKK